ncbi:MAG: VOC family protein [Chloroflexota bacterium]|nr:VOC family protein [Chloroflexota bacterium]MDE2948447.1 VOC family protein [Chloroflexota bacterium]
MLLGIDHIVIAGPDLDTLTASFKALGFNVVGGGRHPIGSYNSLIGLGDGAYIELLSFYEDSPKHYWWDAVQSKGGGLIDFCMQTDDIRGDYAAFAAQGVEMSPLVGLSRVRFDGYQLSWLNNEIYGQFQGLIPFIIEDETPREERLPKDKDHENGVTGIDSITLAARNIGLAARVMSAVLGEGGSPMRDDALQASGYIYEVGPHRLEYLTPDDESSPLHQHIALKRPTPYRIRFKTAGAKAFIEPEDAAGARLEFV